MAIQSVSSNSSKVFERYSKYPKILRIVAYIKRFLGNRKNYIVNSIIREKHGNLSHVGVQITLNSLREKFWIIGGRRAIRSVIKKCIICRRHEAQSFKSIPAPLPLNRVRDVAVFEVTGIDYAGLIFLKGGQKAWICIFTCAVFRAVHFS